MKQPQIIIRHEDHRTLASSRPRISVVRFSFKRVWRASADASRYNQNIKTYENEYKGQT